MAILDYLAGLNWTGQRVADEAQFCGEDSATGGGTRAGAMVKAGRSPNAPYRRRERGTFSTGLASSAHLLAQYLADRCDVTPEDVQRWHCEQHPECFDDEPHGGVS